MLTLVLEIFARIVALIMTLLPFGPTVPESTGDVIRMAVSTAKGLEPLVGSSHALICIVAIALFEIAYGGFRVVSWTYQKVRSG